MLRYKRHRMSGHPERKSEQQAQEPEILFGASLAKKRTPLFTKKRAAVLILTLVLGTAAAFLIYQWRKPFHPGHTPVGALFETAVPGFLIEIDQSSGGEIPALIERASRLADPKAQKDLGDAGISHLTATLKAAAELSSEDPDKNDIADRFFQESASLNQSLKERGQPFFLDADILTSRRERSKKPMLFSFYIERETLISAENQNVRVISVHRLDKLNIVQAFLGYTRPRTSAALVLLDEIESQLVQYVLPALSDGDEPLLLDTDSIDQGKLWQRELHQRSKEIVKSALQSIPSVNQEHLQELGGLLARRRKLVRGWQLSLDKQGQRLRLPRRRIPEADYAHDLFGHIALNELREWNEIHDRIAETDLENVFYSVRNHFARSVEAHEAQHRLDYARGMVGLPAQLAKLMGADPSLDLPEGGLFARTRDELSAYLAEIAFQHNQPMLELMLLSRFAFDAEQWGGAYCYAALAATDAIGHELGLPDVKLIGNRSVLREELTERFIAISQKSPDDIRAAARKAWAAYYGAPLAELKAGQEIHYAPWRH